jgi:hypothetical protein
MKDILQAADILKFIKYENTKPKNAETNYRQLPWKEQGKEEGHGIDSEIRLKRFR